MFLRNFSNTQKSLFLDICIYAANADNNFSEEEKSLINDYCTEMNIKTRYEAELDCNTSANHLVEISSLTELKMIVFELLGLILSDNKYEEFEKDFMMSFVKKAQISDNDYCKMLNLMTDLNRIYQQINDIIN